MKPYSLVTTVYNDYKEVIEYLKNIQTQSYPPNEIVIADGGSTDQTIDLIKDFSKASNITIKIISGRRLNIAEGFNVAIKAAKCELIGISTVGNIYERDFFEKLIYRLEKEECDIAYAPVRGWNYNLFSTKYNNMYLKGEVGEQILSNHGFVAKKIVFEHIGYYYEDFYYAGEDTEFVLQVKKNKLKTVCENDAVLRWKTPVDYCEFIKQIKYYYIASLQIEGISVIFKSYKCILEMIMMIIAAIISLNCFLGVCIILMIFFTIKAAELKSAGGDFLLWIIKRYVQIYFFFKFFRFGLGSNIVDRR